MVLDIPSLSCPNITIGHVAINFLKLVKGMEESNIYTEDLATPILYGETAAPPEPGGK